MQAAQSLRMQAIKTGQQRLCKPVLLQAALACKRALYCSQDVAHVERIYQRNCVIRTSSFTVAGHKTPVRFVTSSLTYSLRASKALKQQIDLQFSLW